MSDSGLKLNPSSLFHVYTVLAVLVYLVVVFIAYNNNDAVHAWARLPSWLSNSTILGLFTLLSLVLAGYVTTMVSQIAVKGAGTLSFFGSHVSIGALFITGGLLFVISALFTYRDFNFWPAFWAAFIALIGVIAHFMVAFSVSKSLAYLVIPLIVLLVIAVYYLWNMAHQAEDFSNTSGYFDSYNIKYKSA